MQEFDVVNFVRIDDWHLAVLWQREIVVGLAPVALSQRAVELVRPKGLGTVAVVAWPSDAPF